MIISGYAHLLWGPVESEPPHVSWDQVDEADRHCDEARVRVDKTLIIDLQQCI